MAPGSAGCQKSGILWVFIAGSPLSRRHMPLWVCETTIGARDVMNSSKPKPSGSSISAFSAADARWRKRNSENTRATGSRSRVKGRKRWRCPASRCSGRWPATQATPPRRRATRSSIWAAISGAPPSRRSTWFSPNRFCRVSRNEVPAVLGMCRNRIGRSADPTVGVAAVIARADRDGAAFETNSLATGRLPLILALRHCGAE